MTLAFIFPGQGSQKLGMLSDFAEQAVVRDTFEQAQAVLGYDLWALIQDGPEEQLNRTTITQPAMLSADVALWRLWCASSGAMPAVVAGHSLGEWAAVVAAAALPFTEALALVQQRAQLMQQAVAPDQGVMAAVMGLDQEQVQAVLSQLGAGVMEAVNLNAPDQIVIAGELSAFEAASAALKQAGAKRVLKLAVSVPAHSSLMKPAAEAFAQLLDRAPWQMPQLPLIHNASLAPADNLGQLKSLLAQQLCSPVPWTATCRLLAQQGVRQLVECGPGKVLGALVKRSWPEAQIGSLGDTASFEEALRHGH